MSEIYSNLTNLTGTVLTVIAQVWLVRLSGLSLVVCSEYLNNLIMSRKYTECICR